MFVDGAWTGSLSGAILVGLSAIAVARWLPTEFTHQEGVEIAVVEEYV